MRKSTISSVGVEDGIRNSPLRDKLSESAGLKYNLKRTYNVTHNVLQIKMY